MHVTRRGFLRAASLPVVLPVLHGSSDRDRGERSPHQPSSNDSVDSARRRASEQSPGGDPSALAAHAVDVAMAAGASYADVRLTRTREQRFLGVPWTDDEFFGAGVRVLVNGAWGFLSSAVWTPEEMTRLARGAVAQASASAITARQVDLGAAPPSVRGTWTMPVRYDPFEISLGEKMDFANDVCGYIQGQQNAGQSDFEMRFHRQSRVFASSEGASWEQTLYTTRANFVVGYRPEHSLGLEAAIVNADFLSPAGKGWEYLTDSGLFDRIPRMRDEAKERRRRVTISPGVYDVVFNAAAMASLVHATLAPMTELDRALGYEANATGTSSLNDPLNMLGVYTVGSPLVNLVADRSTVGGAATVKWDDEAVAPDPFSLITNGVLVDYQTTREQSVWLGPYYRTMNRPASSHGCAGAMSGLTMTTQVSPNFRLLPGAAEASFDDLVASVQRGIAVVSLRVVMDQQTRTGIGYPVMRRIIDGKLGAFIDDRMLIFRSRDVWKNLRAIGGPASEEWRGFEGRKGQPEQRMVCSVGAVPAIVTNMRIVNTDEIR